MHPLRGEHYSANYHAAAILLDTSSGRELARATCPPGIPTAEAIDRAVAYDQLHDDAMLLQARLQRAAEECVQLLRDGLTLN